MRPGPPCGAARSTIRPGSASPYWTARAACSRSARSSRQGRSGVSVRDGGHPRLDRCRIHHASGAGIGVTGDGSGLEAFGCEVYEIKGSGIQVTARASAHLTDCTVHRTSADGVTLDTDAVLTLADCDIHDIPENAVDLRSRSVLTLTRSTVRRFGRNGLSVWTRGPGSTPTSARSTTVRATIRRSGSSDGATVILDACRVHDVPDALFVLDRGSRSRRGGQRPLPDPQHRRVGERQGRPRSSTTAGSGRRPRAPGSVTTAAAAALNNCTVDAAQTGVIVTKGADPTIERCTVTSPAEAGFYVSAEGRGTFDGCRVTGSEGYGFHVMEGCRTTLTRCRTERCARAVASSPRATAVPRRSPVAGLHERRERSADGSGPASPGADGHAVDTGSAGRAARAAPGRARPRAGRSGGAGPGTPRRSSVNWTPWWAWTASSGRCGRSRT